MYAKTKLRHGLITGMVFALSLGTMSFQAPPAQAAGMTYYVSKASNASDTNNGSASAPFRSIQKCAGIAQPGDTCIVSGGIYRETVAPTNSGTSGNPITFQAAPNETVVVSGANLITTVWSSAGISGYPGIYKTPYTRSSQIDETQQQFFVVPKDISGNHMTGTPTLLWEARWPNLPDEAAYNLPSLEQGMAYMKSGTTQTMSGNAVINHKIVDYELPTNVNWTGALVWARGGDAYTGQTNTVTAFDAATRTLTMPTFAGDHDYYWLRQGNPYFLSGVLGALDEPSEWYADGTNLYLLHPSETVPTQVEAKTRQTAFDLSGKSHIHISGIDVFAANVLMNTKNGVPSEYNVVNDMTANYVYFSDFNQGTSMEHQRERGINIAGNHNEIKNSTIAYSSGTLIHIAGNDNRVVNNRIHDGTYMASSDALIRLSSGSRNLISHNEIRDSGRQNILITQGSGEIAYNDIYWGMRLSRDGGLIYSWGSDMNNTEIHHNWIHDSKGNGTSVGVYLDNFADNAIVHHNVIFNNDTGIQLGGPGNFRLIYNNTIVDNDKSIGYHWTDAYTDENYGTRIFNNIMTDKAFSLEADRNLFLNTVTHGYNVVSGAGLTFGANYVPQAGSTAIDAGAKLPGITDKYSLGGNAPDAGAYELGGGGNSGNWIPSVNFMNPPNPVYAAVDTPYMNLIRNGGFERGIGASNHWLPWEATAAKVDWKSSLTYTKDTGPWLERGLSSKLRLGDPSSTSTGSAKGDGVEQAVAGLKPNTSYTLTAWVHNEPSETVHLGIENYYYASTPPRLSIASTAQTYTREALSFTTGSLAAPDGSTIPTRVQLFKNKSYANHYSYADNVGLIEATPFASGLNDGTWLKEVKFPTQTTAKTAGQTGTLTLSGTLRNGASASFPVGSVQYTSADPNVVQINSANGGTVSYTATGPGQTTIAAVASGAGGVKKGVYHVVTVYPVGTPATTEYMAKAYGSNASGFATLSNGAYTLIGKGVAITGSSDDFVFLNKSVPNSNAPTSTLILKANIEFSYMDPGTIGLMLREQDSASSKHVQFRMDGIGDYPRFDSRSQTAGATITTGQNFKTGVEQIPGATGKRALPIMLVKTGTNVKAFYLDDSKYILFDETTVSFTGANLLAGVALRTGSGKPEAKAVITDLEVTRNY
ncbi:right-handed parallel beta-helix repeat-containing protein [Paenibacillus antri]|nr:right-handed parallel beta-helix repeat-containing protein [Paenibacillus antri]